MIDEAVILCGGLGTRLRAVVSDVPKPMAPVAGRPFLEYPLSWLARQGVRRVVLSVGYLREVVIDHFGDRWGGLDIAYAIEEQPLGTGGGLRLGLGRVQGAAAYALNGDSFLAASLQPLATAFAAGGSPLTLAVKPELDVGRFGACVVQEGRLVGFREGRAGEAGLINAGVYVLARDLFETHPAPERFSFEQDFLAPRAGELRPPAVVLDAPFIDIGVPESFALAQRFVPQVTRT